MGLGPDSSPKTTQGSSALGAGTLPREVGTAVGVSSAWDAGLGAACAVTLPGTRPGCCWPRAAPWGGQIALACRRGRGCIA